MPPANYHKLLAEQIQKALGPGAHIPDDYQTLLQLISKSYMAFDQDRQQAEAKVALRTDQLIASTSRAYSFLDSLNMGFIMCDVNPEVVLTNLSVKHMLAAKTSSAEQPETTQPDDTEWKLDSIDKLLRPEVQLKELILESLATNKPFERKEVNFGQRVLHLFIAPMVNEEKNGEKQQLGVVILVEDITEQKVLDRSKDEFLSIASHELRTPLTAIRGNAAMIKKYYAASLVDKDMAEMIADIHESSVRLISIVNDFLDASALEQGKIRMNPEVFQLGEVASDVVRELQHLCDAKGVKLIQDPSAATVPSVTADKQRIKQVIYNLVGNATKFTEQGSITISGRSDEQYVYIVVSDTGRGMSAESQHLLFRKFQQAGSSLLTRDTTKGTGLGLYISKLIVELSGGKIGLEHSEPGQGSVFSFSLPRASSTIPTAPENAELTNSIPQLNP